MPRNTAAAETLRRVLRWDRRGEGPNNRRGER